MNNNGNNRANKKNGNNNNMNSESNLSSNNGKNNGNNNNLKYTPNGMNNSNNLENYDPIYRPLENDERFNYAVALKSGNNAAVENVQKRISFPDEVPVLQYNLNEGEKAMKQGLAYNENTGAVPFYSTMAMKSYHQGKKNSTSTKWRKKQEAALRNYGITLIPAEAKKTRVHATIVGLVAKLHEKYNTLAEMKAAASDDSIFAPMVKEELASRINTVLGRVPGKYNETRRANNGPRNLVTSARPGNKQPAKSALKSRRTRNLKFNNLNAANQKFINSSIHAVYRPIKEGVLEMLGRQKYVRDPSGFLRMAPIYNINEPPPRNVRLPNENDPWANNLYK